MSTRDTESVDTNMLCKELFDNLSNIEELIRNLDVLIIEFFEYSIILINKLEYNNKY